MIFFFFCFHSQSLLKSFKVESLIEEYRRPGDVVVFTDGSVVRGTKSGWAFSARDGDSLVRVREMSGATEVTTSSMYMEVIAITESLKWLKDTAFESATIVTDSLCTLEKVRNGMLYADWKEAICGSNEWYGFFVRGTQVW